MSRLPFLATSLAVVRKRHRFCVYGEENARKLRRLEKINLKPLDISEGICYNTLVL